MTPISHSVLAAIPFPANALLNVKGFFPPSAPMAESAEATRPPAVDPASAYGCVDWYLYPDTKPENAGS
jgi:hypothetical protein